MVKLVTVFFSMVQSLLLVLMAPLMLAVCAGVVVCTYLITRQLRRSSRDRAFVRTAAAFEWTGSPSAEWLGA